MGFSVEIGVFHEKEERRITDHTSYAADYINHKTIPGDYPTRVIFEGLGNKFPMPNWLMIKIDTEVIDGEYFSSFCGVNFASTPAEKGPSSYTIQTYTYHIPKWVENGLLTLKPEYEFLNQEYRKVLEHIKEHGLPEN